MRFARRGSVTEWFPDGPGAGRGHGEDAAAREPELPRARLARSGAILLGGLALTFVVLVLSVGLGARDISPAEVVSVLLHPYDDYYNAHVLWTERIPRTLLGALVGAALGASGLIMQALTLNPLSDPGILGVEVGASFAVVVGIVAFGIGDLHGYFWFALLGAGATAALVYLVGTRAAGGSAIGLVLAGAAVAALLASAISLLVVRSASTAASLRFWSVGQLTGRAEVLPEVTPFLAAGLLLALPLGRTLNILALGEDAAAGLGVRVGRAQLLCAGVAVLLCAAATAGVGPVAFVGLVGGHLARMLVGADHRASLPVATVAGAVLLLSADVAGRLAPGSGELEVGITTAVIGTPFFIWLARRPNLVTL
ncbi:MAG: iron ABC transporter permease [Micropruina sp.]|uniref:FecCD family ABC transporter permease n=1 Tax=Micropruina sp. TaxID=2737536 RepID=UPI0039E299F6